MSQLEHRSMIYSMVLAELIREEKDTGKLIIVGAYASNNILLDPLLPAFDGENRIPLSLYLQVRDVPGQELLFSMIDPEGDVIFSAEARQNKDAQEPGSLVFDGGTLNVEAFGVYLVKIESGGYYDARPFLVTEKKVPLPFSSKS